MKYLISVVLFLCGDDLDPAIVTEKLGINPSYSQYRGERKITPTNHEYFVKFGRWDLYADSDSCILSDHIKQLTSQIGTDGNTLRSIEGVQRAYLDVFIGSGGKDTCEFELDRESLTALKQLDIPVCFTVASGPE